MLINEKRALAYSARVNDITPIEGADSIELITIEGWKCVAKKGEFLPGDLCIYFEIDSKLPADAPWAAFLAPRKFKVKTMKINKFNVFSQGLALPYSVFGELISKLPTEPHIDVTDLLSVTYAEPEDNARKKSGSRDDFKDFKQKHAKLFNWRIIRFLSRFKTFRTLLTLCSAKKRKKNKFPTDQFAGVGVTDQERCENMPFLFTSEKFKNTPFIVTEKCDGSSATYILKRKSFGRYEFYVCSRNYRLFWDNANTFDYYWEIAKKYDIEAKMKLFLRENPDIDWVCWQGEICAPKIQKNPHKLTETHFYCFHWTDSAHGRLDITKAQRFWKTYQMEVVPIVDTNYYLPSTLEEFKTYADGYYQPEVCEGNAKAKREGVVLYSKDEPWFSFKNVSREYLLKH